MTVLLLCFFVDLMQRWRLGQGMQSLVENFIFTTRFVRLSTGGLQLMLRLPSGQAAIYFSQSRAKAAASKPVPSLACHL